MLPTPPPFSDQADIAAFAAIPIEERLGGRDILAMIGDAALADPDHPALHYLPTGTAGGATSTVTRRELVRSAASCAARLAGHGIGHDDVVATLLPNGPGTIVATIGALSAGILAPINIFLEVEQIRSLLRDSAAKAMLVPRNPPPALASMFAALRQVQGDDSFRVIEIDTDSAESDGHDDHLLRRRSLPDRVALFHTGGTTGLPKFVPLRAANLATAALISQFAYGFGEDDNIPCAMPMFHVGGLFACSLFPLTCGARVSILGALGFRGEGVVVALPDTIASLGVSVMIGPPTIMTQLASRPPDMSRARNLRLFVSGAAALPRASGTKLSEATGVPVVEPWGLTESTLAVASGPRDGLLKQGSVGLALPYCEVKAFQRDAMGALKECKTDDIGVLGIRSPMVFDGYLDRVLADQPFLEGRWLDTGDLGRVDADGFVWVTGRAKEIIKRGGHSIEPGAIEDALQAHPDVVLAAAIGKPDAYAGELPIAYVQPRSGATLDPNTLVEFVRERITERAAVPKEIVIVERLPLTAVGKVHKQTLRLDITRRVVDSVVRQCTGSGTDAEINVEAHALHGLLVRVRVPATHVDAVKQELDAFAFRSDISALKEDK